jgi:hypothetical protein
LRRAGRHVPALRLFGSAALAVVAVSPRLYFYDALVLAVPAAAWYLCRDGYASRWVRRLQGGCLAGVTTAGVLFFPWPVAVTAVGPLAAAWAVLEAVDLRAGTRQPQAGAADGDRTPVSRRAARRATPGRHRGTSPGHGPGAVLVAGDDSPTRRPRTRPAAADR